MIPSFFITYAFRRVISKKKCKSIFGDFEYLICYEASVIATVIQFVTTNMVLDYISLILNNVPEPRM